MDHEAANQLRRDLRCLGVSADGTDDEVVDAALELVNSGEYDRAEFLLCFRGVGELERPTGRAHGGVVSRLPAAEPDVLGPPCRPHQSHPSANLADGRASPDGRL